MQHDLWQFLGGLVAGGALGCILALLIAAWCQAADDKRRNPFRRIR